jgi:hypothetical protein
MLFNNRLKYARDDEDPVPWSIEDLVNTPEDGSMGFYPLSKFSIFLNMMRSNDTLHFPEYLWVSRNHYQLAWKFNRSRRRLKNVIVIMEWTPTHVRGAVPIGKVGLLILCINRFHSIIQVLSTSREP